LSSENLARRAWLRRRPALLGRTFDRLVGQDDATTNWSFKRNS
jgi:hypothetical protein